MQSTQNHQPLSKIALNLKFIENFATWGVKTRIGKFKMSMKYIESDFKDICLYSQKFSKSPIDTYHLFSDVNLIPVLFNKLTQQVSAKQAILLSQLITALYMVIWLRFKDQHFHDQNDPKTAQKSKKHLQTIYLLLCKFDDNDKNLIDWTRKMKSNPTLAKEAIDFEHFLNSARDLFDTLYNSLLDFEDENPLAFSTA